MYYVKKRFKKWHFRGRSLHYLCCHSGQVKKVQKCAYVVYGWTLVYVSHAKWRQGHPRVVIHYIVGVWLSPFYFPMQNPERAYYFDNESKAAFWSKFLRAISHSRFRHYFCSNLYGSAPRGPRGVKKLRLGAQSVTLWNTLRDPTQLKTMSMGN